MKETFEEKFNNILCEEEKVMDSILEKQSLLHKAVKEKNWESLMSLISEINLLSDNFQKLENERNIMQAELKTEELRPFFEQMGRLRSKLTKSKIENQALSKYISITKGFVQGIIDNVVPNGNKVYTKNGIVQSQPKSVVLNVSM